MANENYFASKYGKASSSTPSNGGDEPPASVKRPNYFAQKYQPESQVDHETPEQTNTRINEQMAERQAQKDRGFWNNTARGTGERAAELAGNMVDSEAIAAGQRPETPWGLMPAAGPVPPSSPRERVSEEERAQSRQEIGEAGQKLRDVDLGYDEEKYSLEGAGNQWKRGNYLGAATELLAAGNETLLTSLPDMVGSAVPAITPAYVIARSNEIGRERAINSGREQPDSDDMMLAMPAAIASTLLERILPSRVSRSFGDISPEMAKDISDKAVQHVIKKAAKEGLASAGIEGATEFVQEGVIEYLGGRLGTDAAIDYKEMLARGTEAAILGAVGGGTVGGARGGVEGASDARQARRIPQNPDLDPNVPRETPDSSKFVPGESYRHRTGPGSFETVNFLREIEGPDGSPMAEVEIDGQRQYVMADDLSPRSRLMDQTPEELEAELTGDPDLDAEIRAAVDEVSALRTQAEQRADQEAEQVRYEDGVDFEPQAVPESPAFELEPIDQAPPGDGVPFERPEIPADTSTRDNLAAGIEGRIRQEQSRKADESIDQKLPEGLPDRRIIREDYRTRLQGMAQDLVKGGGVSYLRDENDRITGRTPSLNPEWFQNLGLKATTDEVRTATEKALAGEKLGKKQAAIVELMLDEAQEQRAKDRPEAVIERWKRLDDLRSGIESQNEQEITDSLELEPLEGERAVEAALSELTDDALEMGIPQEQVFEALDRYADRAEGNRQRLLAMFSGWMRATGYERNQQESVVSPGRGQEGGDRAAPAAEGAEGAQPSDSQREQRDDGVPFESGPVTESDTEATARALGIEPEPALESYTEQDLAQRAEQQEASQRARDEQERQAEQRAQADRERDDFVLAGSDTASDQAAARGQEDLLSGASANVMGRGKDESAQRGQKVLGRLESNLSGRMDMDDGSAMESANLLLGKNDRGRLNDYLDTIGATRSQTKTGEKRSFERDQDTYTISFNSGGNVVLRKTSYPEAEKQQSEPQNIPENIPDSDDQALVDAAKKSRSLDDLKSYARGRFGREKSRQMTDDGTLERIWNKRGATEVPKAHETSQRELNQHIKANTEAQPSEAQKEAGNYRKAKINVQGLEISIENPRGTKRTGTDPKGEKWSVTMKSSYGYIRRTEGADGEHVDVFVGPKPDSDQVFIIDQLDQNGGFDEHKVMIGFPSKMAARSGYKANYTKGWKVGPITKMSMDEFKQWLKDGDLKNPLTPDFGNKPEAPASDQPTEPTKPIQDFGEKIGGARKDTSESTGPRGKSGITSKGEIEKQPYHREFKPVLGENLSDMVDMMGKVENDAKDKYLLIDARRDRPVPNPRGRGQFTSMLDMGNKFSQRFMVFDTLEAANRHAAIMAVAKKHRVRPYSDGGTTKYRIERQVSDRKRWVIKDGFKDESAAQLHLAQNAAEIFNQKTSFGEADLVTTDDPERTGKQHRENDRDVFDREFYDTFGFRGVEFGNWNNQNERQELLNRAYDGLMDLSELIGVPPKALSLNGDLALAFGARGHGLQGARAHYEPARMVINLTKMTGSGALAHEWMHALDHYLSRQDKRFTAEFAVQSDGTKAFPTKAVRNTERVFASYGNYRRANGELRPELANAYMGLVNAMMVTSEADAEGHVNKMAMEEKFLNKELERADQLLDEMRQNLASEVPYGRKKKPATEEQLQRFDELAKKIRDRSDIDVKLKNLGELTGRPNTIAFYDTNDTLDALAKLFHEVRGRWPVSKDKNRAIDRIGQALSLTKRRTETLENLKKQAPEEATRVVSTQFKRDALDIDMGRVEDYWSSRHEMVARAFSAYIEDKAKSKKLRSDFLSYGSDNRMMDYVIFGIKPFPEGDERKAINDAFDKLFNVIETEAVDDNVMIREETASYTINEEQLSLYDGAGLPTKEAQMQARDNFSLRYEQVETRQMNVGFDVIDSVEKAAHVFAPTRKSGAELFSVLILDANDKPISVVHIGKGQRDGANISAADVAGAVAATPNAKKVYLSHNHPSGATTPSRADYQITQTIVHEALDGLGVQYQGHVIVGADGNATAFYDDEVTKRDFKAAPAARNKRIPVTERTLRYRGKNRQAVTSPDMARVVAAQVESPNALILLDTQHYLAGVLNLTRAEMAAMRDGKTVTRVMEGINRSNATAAIIKSDDREAARNLARFMNRPFMQRTVNMLDILSPGRVTDVESESAMSTGDREMMYAQGPFYSRGQGQGDGNVTKSMATRIVNRVTKGLGAQAIPINVVDDVADLPERIQADIRQEGFGTFYGGIFDGEIWVDRSAHSSPEAFETTLLHEFEGHHGLRSLYKGDVLGSMGRLYTAMGGAKGVMEIAKRHNIDLTPYSRDLVKDMKAGKISNDMAYAAIAEELLAHLAGDSRPTVKRRVQELLGALREWLRTHGFPRLAKIKDSDLALVLRKAREAANAPVDPVSAPAYSRRDPEMDPENVDKEAEVARKLGLTPKENDSLLGKIREIKNAGLRAQARDAASRSYEGLFDGLIGIKRAEEAAGLSIERGADGKNFERSGYVGARLATGVADVMHHLLNYGAMEWKDGVLVPKNGTRGVLELFGELGEDLNDWLMWMAGNRAAELMKEGRENNLTRSDVTYLMGKAKGRLQKFKKAKAEYNQINAAMLDVAEGAGLINPESRAQWESEWYVPFYRQDPDEGGIMAPRSKRGLSHQTAGIKALRGGDRATGDLLENIMTNWLKLADSSIKNSALLKSVDNLRDTDFLSDESLRYTPAIVSKSEMVKRVREDYATAKQMALMMGVNQGDGDLVSAVESELKAMDKTGFEKLWAITAPTEPDIIRVQRNGKNEYYRVHDESLLRAFSHMNYAGAQNILMRGGRLTKRILTAGITTSPDFIIRNFIRDAMHAWTINPDGFRFAVDSAKGLANAIRKDDDYKALIAGGAAFQGGYIQGTDPEAASRMIRRDIIKGGLSRINRGDSVLDTPGKMWAAVKWGWQHYREVGDKVENANRLATYKAALEAGKPPAQALFESKDLMDYSRRGNFAALIWLTDLVPFMNARLQGMDRLVRSGKSIPAIAGRKAAMIALFSFWLASLNDDEERYNELPNWEKDAYWHFFVGEHHWRIPKPFELGIIAGTFPERIWHAMIGEQGSEELKWTIKHNLMGTFGFSGPYGLPIPQMINPAIEIAANRSFFFDKPIESLSDEGVIPEARYNQYTSDTMVALGDWLGMSPKKLEHLLEGYTGTMGAYALEVADVVTRANNGEPAKAERAIPELPVVGSFYRGTQNRQSQYMTDFYDMVKEADEVYRTVKKYREEGRYADAKELIEANKKELASRKLLLKARRKLSDINNRIEVISQSDLAPADKRERIDQLNRAKLDYAKQVVKNLEDQ